MENGRQQARCERYRLEMVRVNPRPTTDSERVSGEVLFLIPAVEIPEPRPGNTGRSSATAGTTGCGLTPHHAFDLPLRCRLR